MLPVLLAAATVSAAPASGLVDRLVAEGFENVAVETQGGRTTVWFEDRRSLDANVGLGQVARLVAQQGVRTDAVELIVLRERLPMLGVSMPLSGLKAYLEGGLSEPGLRQLLAFDPLPPGPSALDAVCSGCRGLGLGGFGTALGAHEPCRYAGHVSLRTVRAR